MTTTTQALAGRIAAWIESKGGSYYPRACELGISPHTLRAWAIGTTLPKARDLPAIASAIGATIEELAALRLADHQARLVAAGGVRVDTPDEARAWATANTPAATREDGAADGAGVVHAGQDAQRVGA